MRLRFLILEKHWSFANSQKRLVVKSSLEGQIVKYIDFFKDNYTDLRRFPQTKNIIFGMALREKEKNTVFSRFSNRILVGYFLE